MNLEILKYHFDQIVRDLEIVKPYLDHEYSYNKALHEMSVQISIKVEKDDCI